MMEENPEIAQKADLTQKQEETISTISKTESESAL
jgi:hypothetical protein